MNIAFSTLFKKSYNKLPSKIQIKVDEKIGIFTNDEFNSVLKNHKLHGVYADFRSISITSDIRIVYRKVSKGDYIFHDIGTHSKLYE